LDKAKLPLQRLFLVEAINEALGRLSVDDLAEKLGFDRASISRWRNSDDPGRDALKQIYFRMHGPTGGTASYSSVENDAHEFVTSFFQLQEVHQGTRRVEDVSSPAAVTFLSKREQIAGRKNNTAEVPREMEAVEEIEVIYSASDVPVDTPFEITFHADSSVSINTQIKRTRKLRPDIFDKDVAGVSVQIKIRRPSRNSDGEPRMVAMIVRADSIDAFSMDDLNWLTDAMQKFPADDRKSRIVGKLQLIEE
jgi:hypothetical protein